MQEAVRGTFTGTGNVYLLGGQAAHGGLSAQGDAKAPVTNREMRFRVRVGQRGKHSGSELAEYIPVLGGDRQGEVAGNGGGAAVDGGDGAGLRGRRVKETRREGAEGAARRGVNFPGVRAVAAGSGETKRRRSGYRHAGNAADRKCRGGGGDGRGRRLVLVFIEDRLTVSEPHHADGHAAR